MSIVKAAVSCKEQAAAFSLAFLLNEKISLRDYATKRLKEIDKKPIMGYHLIKRNSGIAIPNGKIK